MRLFWYGMRIIVCDARIFLRTFYRSGVAQGGEQSSYSAHMGISNSVEAIVMLENNIYYILHAKLSPMDRFSRPRLSSSPLLSSLFFPPRI